LLSEYQVENSQFPRKNVAKQNAGAKLIFVSKVMIITSVELQNPDYVYFLYKVIYVRVDLCIVIFVKQRDVHFIFSRERIVDVKYSQSDRKDNHR